MQNAHVVLTLFKLIEKIRWFHIKILIWDFS